MHGLGGHRGIIRTRALSFVLYVLALVTGIAAIPLMLAGPRLVDDALPARFDFLLSFYWPVVGVICICFLATLYHVSVPVRTRWRFNLPGRGVLAGRPGSSAATCCAGSSPPPPRTRARSTARWPRPSPYSCGSTSSPSRS